MLTKKQIDKMFIRQELTEDQEQRAEEIERAAHALAILIKENVNILNCTVEEAILHAKKAAMLARVAIAAEDR